MMLLSPSKKKKIAIVVFFGTPLFMYFKQIQELSKDRVTTFMKENGAKHDPQSFSEGATIFFFFVWK